MPPPKPQPQPPKPRTAKQVLSAEEAKELATPKHRTPFPPLNPKPKAHPQPDGPSLAPKSPFRTLFSRLRERYTSLPGPVKHTCRVLRVLAPLVPISLFFSEHVAQIMWVRGPSMTPYLNEDYDQMQTKRDLVLVNMSSLSRFWPWNRTIRLERGMVVTFRYASTLIGNHFPRMDEMDKANIDGWARSPANSHHIAIKRIIGLPGDRITTREPCMKPTQIVPFNHVWLEGDAEDPHRSLDSNTYGPVSISLLTGRVTSVLGPRARALKWEDWESREEYHQGVRDRVVKEAVELERPAFE